MLSIVPRKTVKIDFCSFSVALQYSVQQTFIKQNLLWLLLLRNHLSELLLDLEKVSWFLSFLALGCKATFIGLVYWICCNYKESRELFMSRVSGTYRNDDILPSVSVYLTLFLRSQVFYISREQMYHSGSVDISPKGIWN